MATAAAPAAPTQETQHEPALLERLKARTSPVRQAVRGPVYNHPSLWYARPDGDVVRLPGDPQNRAYYEDKGYAVLRPDERGEWEGEVRPLVAAAQREKAAVIGTIRRVAKHNPGLDVVADLDAMALEELRELLGELGQAAGVSTKVVGARFLKEQAAAEAPDPHMAGVTLASGAELADKLKRATQQAGRATQGTQGTRGTQGTQGR